MECSARVIRHCHRSASLPGSRASWVTRLVGRGLGADMLCLGCTIPRHKNKYFNLLCSVHYSVKERDDASCAGPHY